MLAYLSLLAVLTPCEALAGPRQKKTPLRLTEFVEKLLAHGEETRLPPVLAKLMEFPADAETKKGLGAEPSDTNDGIDRSADVVMKLIEGKTEPVGLYWTTNRKSSGVSESYDFHSTLDGDLKKVVRVTNQIDEDGKVVRGSGKAVNLDVHDRDVRGRFQRDVLDFWLRSKGRKKADAKRTRSKAP